jgi:RNA polymerase sigma factor (sigma-70 family)
MTEAHAEKVRRHANEEEAPGKELDGLFEAHAAKVRGLCRYVLGSREQAEDAVSEVYLKARQAQRLYDADQPFGAWIMSIARHYCFDVLRRRRVEARLFTASDVDADARPDAAGQRHAPLARVLAHEARQALRVAIERLPPRYRLPLVLRYYEELSYDEIAREMEVTRQEVATLLFRAKQKLRAALAAGAATEGV